MILHAYIAREILVPCFIGFALFTSVFLSEKVIRLLDLLLTQGIAFDTIARLYLLSLPSFLPITIPLSFLVGLTVGFARFSADGEYMAMRITGKTFRSLLISPLVFACLFYGLSVYVTFVAQPRAAGAFKELLRETAESQIQAAIKERFFFDEFENLLLYIQKVSHDKQTFEGVFIGDQSESRDTIVIAQKGMLSLPTQEAAEGEQESRKFVLQKGVSLSRRTEGDELTAVQFDRYELPLRYVRKTFLQPLPDPRDLTHTQLRGELRRMRSEDYTREEIFPYEIELHRKWSMPFSCFVFLLLGPTLVAVAKGAGALRGYWVCLSLAFVYYLALTAATRLGERGLIQPLLVAWTPNVLFLAVGGFLYSKRERLGV